MIAGFAGQERPRRVLGIDASAKITETREQVERIILDPVYEGKSMAGLIELIDSGEIDRDSRVLYAHLGAQPALNAYNGIF
jgi:1-aminocyclopropane-1-carboxylate deaminase